MEIVVRFFWVYKQACLDIVLDSMPNFYPRLNDGGIFLFMITIVDFLGWKKMISKDSMV